jgi:general secretion pathway protein M
MNSNTPRTAGKASVPLSASTLLIPLVKAWRQRSPREQQLLSVGALVMTLAIIWRVALAPALRTWQEAPARQIQLDAQSQQMQQLQAHAKQLQKPTPITRAEAWGWLENNLVELGPEARITPQGERASLSLNAAPPEALARWLGEARELAQVLPVQAQLQQSVPGETPATWRGILVLRLP